MARDLFPVVVHVLVVREGSVYLLRRAHTGFMDGYFALPGGHQQAGESVSAAARRECLEEGGITPRDLRPVCVMPYRSGVHQGLNFLFETRVWDGTPSINEPDLFDAERWAEFTRLPEPCPDWLPGALEMRAAGDWYREFEWD